jgi:hypothetical protein
MGRLGLAGVVVDRIGRTLKSIADPERGAVAQIAESALEDLVGRITRSVDDPGYGALHFRDHLIALVRTFQVAHMLEVAEDLGSGAVADELTAAAGLLASATLDPEYVSGDDPRLLARIDACLGRDAGRGADQQAVSADRPKTDD